MTTPLTNQQLLAIGHDHQVWMIGMLAGRDSVREMETYGEALARSPFLVDDQDPINLIRYTPGV